MHAQLPALAAVHAVFPPQTGTDLPGGVFVAAEGASVVAPEVGGPDLWTVDTAWCAGQTSCLRYLSTETMRPVS